MASFSAKERYIARILGSMPALKNKIKYIYQAICYLRYGTKNPPYRSDYPILMVGKDDDMGDSSFGGYYDRPTINGDYAFTHITTCDTSKRPQKDKCVKVSIYDMNQQKMIDVGNSFSYTWQQGCKTQWIDEDRLIYNVFEDGRYQSCVYFVKENKVMKKFDWPNQDSYKDQFFLSIDYRRIMALRPDYGYRNLPLPTEVEMKDVENDGIRIINMQNGETRMLHSLKEIASVEQKEIFGRCKHVANHLMINKAGSHFIFIHRFYEGKVRHDRLMVSDFESMKVLVDNDMVSHCHWIDNERIIGYFRYQNKDGFYFCNVITGEVKCCEPMTALQNGDGHPSCYGDWITFDSYPDKGRMQHLYLYNMVTEQMIHLLEVKHGLKFQGEGRCDLHPRFSSDGKYISFDSVMSGKRQQYYINVSDITK